MCAMRSLRESCQSSSSVRVSRLDRCVKEVVTRRLWCTLGLYARESCLLVLNVRSAIDHSDRIHVCSGINTWHRHLSIAACGEARDFDER